MDGGNVTHVDFVSSSILSALDNTLESRKRPTTPNKGVPTGLNKRLNLKFKVDGVTINVSRSVKTFRTLGADVKLLLSVGSYFTLFENKSAEGQRAFVSKILNKGRGEADHITPEEYHALVGQVLENGHLEFQDGFMVLTSESITALQGFIPKPITSSPHTTPDKPRIITPTSSKREATITTDESRAKADRVNQANLALAKLNTKLKLKPEHVAALAPTSKVALALGSPKINRTYRDGRQVVTELVELTCLDETTVCLSLVELKNKKQLNSSLNGGSKMFLTDIGVRELEKTIDTVKTEVAETLAIHMAAKFGRS